MSDITKCSGLECPAKEYCYRYTAPSNELWQSVFENPPIKGFGKSTSGKIIVYCDCYSPNQKKLDKSMKIHRDM